MKLYLFIIIAFISLASAWYYTNKQKNEEIATLIYDNSTLNSEVNKLTESINISNETITQLQDDFENIRINYQNLETEFDMYRKYGNVIGEKFERHDLNSLALAKPELIENLVNKGSANAIRCFELLSGSPKNARELAAKTGNEFNSECPWLK